MIKKFLTLTLAIVLLSLTAVIPTSVSAKGVSIKITRCNPTYPVRVNTPYKLKVSDHKDIIWKSNDETLATVNEKGYVKATKKAKGKTIEITATTFDNLQSAKIKLYVLPKINKDKKMIAITYDDGPRYSTTNKILKVLKDNQAVATFFTLGCNLNNSDNRKILKQSFEYGNEIASHTQNHKELTKLSASGIKSEISKADKQIKSVTGYTPKLIRPPYGSTNSTLSKTSNKPLILWNIDTLDWKTRSTSKTYNSVVNNASDGAIVLMHDIHDCSANAANYIYKTLKKKGYQFVTVSELFKYKGKTLKAGNRYFNCK